MRRKPTCYISSKRRLSTTLQSPTPARRLGCFSSLYLLSLPAKSRCGCGGGGGGGGSGGGGAYWPCRKRVPLSLTPCSRQVALWLRRWFGGGGGGGAYGPCRKRAARRARRLMMLIFCVRARYVIMLAMSVSPFLLPSVSATHASTLSGLPNTRQTELFDSTPDAGRDTEEAI